MKDKVEKYLNALIPTPKSIERKEGYREVPLSIFALLAVGVPSSLKRSL